MIYIGEANDLQYPIDKNQDVSEEDEKIKNTPHHNHICQYQNIIPTQSFRNTCTQYIHM